MKHWKLFGNISIFADSTWEEKHFLPCYDLNLHFLNSQSSCSTAVPVPWGFPQRTDVFNEAFASLGCLQQGMFIPCTLEQEFWCISGAFGSSAPSKAAAVISLGSAGTMWLEIISISLIKDLLESKGHPASPQKFHLRHNWAVPAHPLLPGMDLSPQDSQFFLFSSALMWFSFLCSHCVPGFLAGRIGVLVSNALSALWP